MMASKQTHSSGFDMEVNSDLSRARGGLACAKENASFEGDPATYLDLQRWTRVMRQRAPGQPTGFPGLMAELP